MRIEVDDLSRPQVIALIDHHLREAHANSPPGQVFALGPAGLRDPAMTVWTMWEDDALLAMGALKRLDPNHGPEHGPDHGEVKSMRTAPAHLRRGLGGLMLGHLVAEAQRRGYRRLSLETGNNRQYAPAWAMYERAGFVACGPFADYRDESFSRYFTMEL
ncbi:GNAT family N-acetyltransferase [uncultured Sphingomonas sp.]|uniref:GNAT family N-acetyltransferase n=1 Tax=uncultured Sphingomonas sp. TaxID=158754 RepID=UPI0035CAB057